MRVACLGSGSGKHGDTAYNAMFEVGRLLALAHVTIVTGAYGGTGMKAAPEGALQGDPAAKPIGFTNRDGPGL
jgi:predicted Rossmann-fold nucleotide-binding protein